MKLSDLDTPALILDRRRLEANLARMSERARALGVDLRPHMKTAKSAEVGRLATAGHSGGITVSTLKEAEYFAEHGFTDVVYAVGVSLDKLARVARL
ncbi:MAG: alanine racemase, partial [Proteobacteria bacterium]|nr:alanine racemase [Pseudomonadota bacterium]